MPPPAQVIPCLEIIAHVTTLIRSYDNIFLSYG
jgi:hypothetical protein